MRILAAARSSVIPILAAITCGCGGGEKAAAPQVIVAPAPAPAKSATAATATPRSSADLAPPVAPADAPDPEGLRFFLDHLRAPATAPSSAAPPGVAARALANTALGEAAGSKPDGPIVFAALAVGQILTVPVTLPAGRCATLLAQGGLGVIEIDLFLTAPGAPGAAPAVLASEVAPGPVAVIGGRRGCLSAPAGAPSALNLHAVLRRGQGAVLVQTFTRDAPR